MSTVPVTDWGQAIMTSVAAALVLLLGAIPRVLGFAVILIVGWIIASALAAAISAILRTVKFNELAQRAGLSGFVRKMGVQTDAAGFLATLVKWFVRLIVLVTAFDALGLPAVSQVLQQILLWLPNLIVALVVLVIAGLAANALAGLVRGATAESGLGNPDLLATIARAAVRLLRTLRGTSGSGARCSTRMVSAAKSAVPATKAADGHETQAKLCPAKVTQSKGRLAVMEMRRAPR
jgi:hypothetical protein